MSDIVERLRKFLTMEDHPGDVAFLEAIEEAADEISRKDAEIERLRKAAYPFAAHDWMDAELEDDSCKLTRHSGPVTVGHWRELRAALTASETEETR